MNMRQEMDMHWKVEGVDEVKQEAVIKQKFNRIKMKMTTALGGFEYDSKSEAPPTGPAAMIAPLYKAMTEGEFEIVMTSRGEIKDVKIPQEVIDAFKNSPGAGQMGEMASPEGFKKMISQGALVLPENAPKEGEKWTTTITINNPQVGKQTVDTTYTFAGMKEIDGKTFAVIKPELKMEFGNAGAAEGAEAKDQPQQPGAPQFQMKIVKQESDGEVLFNVDEGRLHTSTLGQKATIDIKAGGQSVQQNIDQKIDVKVTPDTGEAAPESDSTEKSTEKDKEKAASK
jgi:hypothetical protein